MGFDEVQFDYVRFPSDGDLSTAEFGAQYTYQEDERVQTIVDFLTMAREQLTANGVKTAADVFAIVAIFPDDQGIGQRFADFTNVVDYICPMIYPSHFTAGPLGMDESPNANPYDTVLITMNSAAGKVPGQVLKIRPWVQDFTLGDPPYGVAEVQAQVDAALEAGASGWMLWNPDSAFTAGALGTGAERATCRNAERGRHRQRIERHWAVSRGAALHCAKRLRIRSGASLEVSADLVQSLTNRNKILIRFVARYR